MVTIDASSQASFGNVTSVTWKDFPALRSIDLGDKSFPIASSLSVTSNPLLHTISLGNHSFNGKGGNQVVLTSEVLFAS